MCPLFRGSFSIVSRVSIISTHGGLLYLWWPWLHHSNTVIIYIHSRPSLIPFQFQTWGAISIITKWLFGFVRVQISEGLVYFIPGQLIKGEHPALEI